MRRLAPLLLAALLWGCSIPGLPGVGSAPTDAPAPTAAPTVAPTAIALSESARLDAAGLTVQLPAGWHSHVQGNTLTLAPSAAAAALSSPGPELVLTIDATPLRDLAGQFGASAASDPEVFFEVSSGAAQREGYTLSATSAITVAGSPGVQADFASASGAGRLAVILGPQAALRVLGQAAPSAWPAQAPLYEAILNSMALAAPPAPTPAPPEATQPTLLTQGPPGFVLRLGGNAGPPLNRFVAARGLAAAPDGTVYLAESSRGVWAFGPDGQLLRTFGREQLLDAYDVALSPDGELFVADYGRNAVARFRTDGTYVGRWGSAGDGPEQFGLSSPQRLAVGPDGSVYALDARPGPDSGRVVSSVMRFAPDGRLLGRIALPADLAPGDLAVARDGSILLADTFAGAVVQVGPDGTELARFSDPADPQRFAAGAIDLDEQGEIVLATAAAGILKLSPSGQQLAQGGSSVAPGSIPGPGQFSLPNGIAAAPGGVVWVSDNSGEYSALTALRLASDPAAEATAQAAAPAATAVAPTPERLVRQWAADANATSFYAPDYEPDDATGPPNVPGCEDNPNAWAPEAPNISPTLNLLYNQPVFAVGVNVHQSFNPGLIVQVELEDERGQVTTVYTAEPVRGGPCPAILEVRFPQTLTRIVAVRLTLDGTGGTEWAEIDAVELLGVP